MRRSALLFTAVMAAPTAALAGGRPIPIPGGPTPVSEKRARLTAEEQAAARLREEAVTAEELARKTARNPALEAVPGGGPREQLPAAAKAPRAVPGASFAADGAGGFVSVGHGIVCEADAAGVLFVPLDAAGLERRDLALGYSLATVRAGAAVLFDRAAGDAGQAERDRADAVHFRHEGGITEIYQSRATGFEQLFVLSSPAGLPAGEDLVLEGALDTALQAASLERADDRAPIEFHDAGVPVVSMGEAFAIDAANRRIPLATEVEGGVLRITVDGAWLDQATFPVTIDPLFSSMITVTTALENELSVDVAYSKTSDLYLVVWQVEYAADDHDIWGAIFTGDGRVFAPPFAIDDFTSDSLNPSVAWSPNGDRFLVVFEDDSNLIGAYDIWGSIVDLTNMVFGPTFEIHASANDHGWAQVGAQDSPAGGFMVAWNVIWPWPLDDWDVSAKPVSAGGVPGSIVDLTTDSVDSFFPAINKTAGTGATPWLVAWQDDRLVSGDQDVFVRAIDSASAPAATIWQLAFSSFHERTPAVESDGARFVVAYALEVTSSDWDIYAKLFDPSGVILGTHVASAHTAGDFHPAVACWKPAGTGSAEWAIGWASYRTSPSAIFADRVSATLATTIENDLAITSGGFEEAHPAAAARSGSARAEYQFAWERLVGDWDIRAQRLGDNTPPAPVGDFSATPVTGRAPLQVAFTDLSTGAPTSWAWDFQNDGTVDSTSQNPTFTYGPGTYSVKLTVSNAGGSHDVVKTALITVQTGVPNPPQGTIPPVADFTAAPISGPAPLTVQFTDTSTGTITLWGWHFSDSTTSTDQNPSHTFTTPGTYTVLLTVTGPAGANTKVAANLITVTAPGTGSTSAGSTGSGSSPFKKRGGGGGGGCALETGGAASPAGLLPLAALVAVLAVARRRRAA